MNFCLSSTESLSTYKGLTKTPQLPNEPQRTSAGRIAVFKVNSKFKYELLIRFKPQILGVIKWLLSWLDLHALLERERINIKNKPFYMPLPSLAGDFIRPSVAYSTLLFARLRNPRSGRPPVYVNDRQSICEWVGLQQKRLLPSIKINSMRNQTTILGRKATL